MVPDRGDNPRRRVKYSDMIVSKQPISGAYEVAHYDGNERHSSVHYFSNKKQAMKSHKDRYEGK